MKRSAELAEFEARLRYRFERLDLLVRAVTHGSRGGAVGDDNQRLEFLGDRVLGLVIAEALLERDKDASEGQLAPRFNALVRKETCAKIARELDLGAVLKLGRSEMKSGGRRKQALLGDAMEAVIAAVYCDGGFSAAREVVLRHWTALIETVDHDARDPKTALQEWAQAEGFSPPDYIEIARDGPDHAPIFTIKVQLPDGSHEKATAGSKRKAEQAAALALLKRINVATKNND